MTVSREDAVRVLRKWASEKSPLSAILMVDGASVCFSGFMANLPGNVALVAHSGDSGKVVELLLGLTTFEHFEYSEVRDASPSVRESVERHAIAALVMKSKAAQCTLYQLPS